MGQSFSAIQYYIAPDQKSLETNTTDFGFPRIYWAVIWNQPQIPKKQENFKGIFEIV